MKHVKDTIAVHVRHFIRRDMPEVVAIDAASAAVEPWDEAQYLRVRREMSVIGMVAEHGERVVGVMVYELMVGKIRLIRFAVDPQFRRLEVGRQMMDRLKGKLSSYRRDRVLCDVRDADLPVQLFLKAMGFRARKVLRGWFADDADAYRFVYRLPGVPKDDEDLARLDGPGGDF